MMPSEIMRIMMKTMIRMMTIWLMVVVIMITMTVRVVP